MRSCLYQGGRFRCLFIAVLPVTCPRVLAKPPADVSALYEVYVLFKVTAWSHEDTQEVEVVTQVLEERRPHTAGRGR